MMMNKSYVFFIVYRALLHILYHFILMEALWHRHYFYYFHFISEEIKARENLNNFPKVTEQEIGSNSSLLTTNCVSFPSITTSPSCLLVHEFALNFTQSTTDFSENHLWSFSKVSHMKKLTRVIHKRNLVIVVEGMNSQSTNWIT